MTCLILANKFALWGLVILVTLANPMLGRPTYSLEVPS